MAPWIDLYLRERLTCDEPPEQSDDLALLF